ncbi:M43 family zinc metalloprotease [Tenacibaculum pacificus]|uniref:M43 family zinc metalloprotease n=1 Tax=Tenacibaculum pacificus TaxID=3018314 RepID=UPI0022F3E62C|nr:M43 family zinc metalloprotease [Tenacibaculum pacificus]WBX72678.1 M43 family zinc metalloprotease [Tenacibaculum pacificus]
MIFIFGCQKEENNDILTAPQANELPSLYCKSDDMMKEYYLNSPKAKAENSSFEKTRTSLSAKTSNIQATIPVVFHVYGTNFNGKSVTQQTINTALEKVNDDFHGLNPDYNTTDPFFDPIKATSGITFKLATISPTGTPTSGIVFHNENNGYGNRSTDQQVQADAWDNYKYCNVYIQLDLYDNNATNNSGVAWYPDTEMSNNNTARIVYNGQYLHGNTSDEFASILTHEFGHWMNLIHTFDGGCSRKNRDKCDTTGDKVCDTPQTTNSRRIDCSYTRTNCVKEKINLENYMDYAGASGCYKMFTQGQVNRMNDALQHPARFPLWQSNNLTSTGTL